MKPFQVIILIFFCINSFSQEIDSLPNIFKTKPKFFFKFDNRYSFVSNSFTKVTGFKFGLDYDKKLRFGAGNHRLESPLSKMHYIDSGGLLIDSVPAVLKMTYFAAFVEYVFYRNNKWEFSIPVQIGIGNSRYDYLYNETIHQKQKSIVLVYETNIEGHYKIIPYVGIGAGTGLRLMLVNNKQMEENFNSPIYILKIKVFLGEIYRAVFNKPHNV